MNRSVEQKYLGSAKQGLRVLTGVALVAGVIWLAASIRIVSPVHADDDDGEDWKIERGFAIAPVPLNLSGKERRLVGLGSYIVNAQIPCNDCHTQNGSTEFVPTGNPYLLRPSAIYRQEEGQCSNLLGGRQ